MALFTRLPEIVEGIYIQCKLLCLPFKRSVKPPRRKKHDERVELLEDRTLLSGLSAEISFPQFELVLAPDTAQIKIKGGWSRICGRGAY